MLQRKMVAIHGGVIEMDNKAVIFTGDRGAGKSTLTTALRRKGYKFISDDVAGIKIDKVPYVMPGFPYQKLCESAMDNFEYDKEKYTQESLSLLNIQDNFKKVIITYDQGPTHYTDDGIVIMSIYDFLLDPNSLNY